MGHEVLKDTLGAVRDVNIAPVDPGVIGLESRVEEVVTGTTNSLTTRTLGLEQVSLLDAHLHIGTEVLADNGCAAEGDLVIGVVLNAIQFRCKGSQSIIFAVADEEGQIDQLVGVGQLVEEVEILLEVGGGVAEGGQDEDTFTVVNGLDGRFDRVQVDLSDGGAVDFVGFVVVEEDRGLGMGVPLNHLVEGHLHGGFRGAIAVETRCGLR